MDKSTEDLQSELTRAKSFDEFCRKNDGELAFPSAVDYLNFLMKSKNINKAALVAATNLDRAYAYHILSGRKNPGRDKLIIFAIAAKASIAETQNLLKYAKERPLYVRDRRDGLIYYGIEHGKNLAEINFLLDENELDILE
ncbi:MAG: hypothetical protein DBY32_08175 [Phascolarctobacterium sp.]|nr:MAG: hypothetical protein DBY32_08175 [Phascolarctobacterium sp.]